MYYYHTRSHTSNRYATAGFIVQVKDQLELIFDVERDEIIALSAKSGENVEALIPAIISSIPSPAEKAAFFDDGKVRVWHVAVAPRPRHTKHPPTHLNKNL